MYIISKTLYIPFHTTALNPGGHLEWVPHFTSHTAVLRGLTWTWLPRGAAQTRNGAGGAQCHQGLAGRLARGRHWVSDDCRTE